MDGTDLLGRDQEQAALSAILDRARAQAVALVGEAGVGTSALLKYAAAEARERGFRVLSTTGHHDESELDGLAAQQLLIPLRPHIHELPDPDRSVAVDALSLRSRGPAELTAALVASLRALLRRRPGPTLIVVDDLHLVDPVSARVVADLIASPPGPVVFLLGLRRFRMPGLLPPGAGVLPLASLPEPVLARLAAARLPQVTGRGRRHLLRLAGGKPRVIADVARLFPAATTADVLSPPPTWAVRLQQRYAALFAGLDGATMELAGQLGGEDPGPVPTPVLDRAVAAGLLEPTGSTVRLADPLAGLAAYLSRTALDRADQHRRLAAALPAGSLVQARHLAASTTGPSEPVAAALESTGEQARQRGAYADHAEALHRAAELSPAPADAARRYAAALLSAGAMGQTSWVRELYAEVQHRDPAAITDALAAEAAVGLCRSARQREAMDLLLDHARDSVSEPIAAAADLVAQLSGLDEHHAVARRLRRRAGSGAVVPAAHAADLAGDTATAIELRQAALARSGPGKLGELPELFLPLASSLIDAGRWSEADALIARARAACDGADLRLLEVEVVAMQASLAGLHGDGPGARRMVESVWTRIDLQQNRRVGARLRQSLGISAFAEGDHEAAYRHHRALFGPDGTALYPDFTGHMLLGLAVTAVRTGRAEEALRILAATVGPDNPRGRMRRAQIGAMLTDDETSEAGFRAAVDDPAGAAWPFERALARLHYGTWLRRRRRVVDARVHLAEAVTLLENLGAEGLAAIARIELTAAGDPQAEAGPLRALSPQQRQVILLAADGLSNKEIAMHLRMSPRTVGTHLYNAYPKLGIGGRRQLDARLREVGARGE
ncbi:AAA family ATPase [Actinoplanes sp. TRM 88003]|uniref:AAA family ATPase n=1 Tax=Paractinoplanes aksuensis TaxID=2939490 RepID=A0ABT1DT04_9ACTN|nr:AAA family ATPase [Actinoplanes aksuensis]MCO8273959.1 AAA family ATPase [Actinoplanes aksuensis]